MTRLARDAYEHDIIGGDLIWLRAQPRTLEREHVIAIVEASAAHEYGDTAVVARSLAMEEAASWHDAVYQAGGNAAAQAEHRFSAQHLRSLAPMPPEVVALKRNTLEKIKSALLQTCGYAHADEIDDDHWRETVAKTRAALTMIDEALR